MAMKQSKMLATIFGGSNTFNVVNVLLLAILIVTVAVNQLLIWQMKDMLGMKKMSFSFFDSSFAKADSVKLSGDATNDAMKFVISQGQPAIYGPELNVSFDSVQPSMDIMKQFDPTYGQNKITLAGADLQRYINIGLKIACEYCCGAKGLVFQNGQAACGCAHSQAMRGLLAYLITKHGNQYSDDELLRELARWKGMYFPKQMIDKLTGQLQGQPFTPDTASLVLGVNLPNYGKNSAQAPLPSDINNLPSMVGGC